jgi:hypothetical protein
MAIPRHVENMGLRGRQPRIIFEPGWKDAHETSRPTDDFALVRGVSRGTRRKETRKRAHQTTVGVSNALVTRVRSAGWV